MTSITKRIDSRFARLIRVNIRCLCARDEDAELICKRRSPRRRKKINTKFDDPKIAFQSKTTPEILRAFIVYQLFGVKPLVDNNLIIMKVTRKLVGRKLFELLMRSTFYGHFVAGENEEEIVPLLQKMHSFGVGTLLDYSVEEDISEETAVKLEEKALEGARTELPQYKVNTQHLDRREKLYSARTYFYENEDVCERNMETFLRCIECIATSTYNTGMIAIKLTALCKPKLLLQVSEVITKSRMYVRQVDTGGEDTSPVIRHHVKKEKLRDRVKEIAKESQKADSFLSHMISDEEGVIHLFPWSGILNDEFEVNETFQVPDLKTGEMVRFMSQLSSEEEKRFKNMIRRLNTVVRAASETDAKVMVDAEQTYFQPAISRLAVEMMRKYNTDRQVVYNTYQNYLVDSYSEVVSDLEQARRQNFYFGCKLVRGAYMEQERTRAKEMEYKDPVQPSSGATSENYHRTLGECLRQIKELKDQGVKEKRIVIMVASHNEDTVRLAVQKMDEMGIAPDDGSIIFGQLFGMCDFISYSLADAGYGVFKYTPYGPVQEVLPYLSRRANENRGFLGNVKKEKVMLRKELWRRIKTKDFNRNPKGPIQPP